MRGSTQAAVVHYEAVELAVELREMPVPEVGDNDVLLAVGAASVCGLCPATWFGQMPFWRQ